MEGIVVSRYCNHWGNDAGDSLLVQMILALLHDDMNPLLQCSEQVIVNNLSHNHHGCGE
jgi:hypothetical protein